MGIIANNNPPLNYAELLDLKLQLFVKPPRENDGGKTSNRYDYQKDWAICKLIELHRGIGDYLLCFEFHDDILVFDSSSNPKKLQSYQVKTKDSTHWTLNSLVSRKSTKNDPEPSILAKMHGHLSSYGDGVEGLNFVTNSKLKGTLINGISTLASSEFGLKELCEADLEKLQAKLKAELDTQDLDRFCEITKVLLGALDISHHREITKARLAELIEQTMPHINYQIGPLYRTIFDEVKSKTDVEDLAINFDQLKRIKSISRAQFQSYLDAISQEAAMKEMSRSIENRLNIEGVAFSFVRDFNRQAKTYEIERMNHDDANLSIAVEKIRSYVAEYSQNKGIFDSMENISSMVDLGNPILSPLYIKTIILFELYGKR
jgi:hypothetical protein